MRELDPILAEINELDRIVSCSGAWDNYEPTPHHHKRLKALRELVTAVDALAARLAQAEERAQLWHGEFNKLRAAVEANTLAAKAEGLAEGLAEAARLRKALEQVVRVADDVKRAWPPEVANRDEYRRGQVRGNQDAARPARVALGSDTPAPGGEEER